jgi:dihydrofolate synthase/folylpolyglutamate synthase
MVEESDIARLTDRIKRLSEPELSPTFFEFTTAVALQYFADSNVDVAVLEVGLGGRFDATNVVSPLACAITTIALDHQEYLGGTLESIAFEKAGIIKRSVPVIVGRLPDVARDTIERIASERQAPLLCLGRDYHVEGDTPANFRYWNAEARYDGLSCPLLGAHQIDNCASAVTLIETARRHQLAVSESAIRAGLRQVQWEGRLEVAASNPLTVLDGAHNPSAAEALAEYLRRFRQEHPSSRVILVLAMMRDKDQHGFVGPFKGLVDAVVLTQAELKRSATAEELRAVVGGVLPDVRIHSRVSDALGAARELARSQDVVCVTGSLMLIGEVKALLHGSRVSPLRG